MQKQINFFQKNLFIPGWSQFNQLALIGYDLHRIVFYNFGFLKSLDEVRGVINAYAHVNWLFFKIKICGLDHQSISKCLRCIWKSVKQWSSKCAFDSVREQIHQRIGWQWCREIEQKIRAKTFFLKMKRKKAKTFSIQVYVVSFLKICFYMRFLFGITAF